MNSSKHQFATVNLSGEVAENVRSVMRQTGWNVEQSVAHLLTRVVDRYDEHNNLTEVSDLAIEGNEVGVQVVKNTITSYPFNVGAIVMVKVMTDLDVELELFGIVNGFAPQGVGITMTEGSIAKAETYDMHVNKDDLWGYEDITAL